MEKITIEIIQKCIAANSIELAPTQQRLCVPIINRICNKMRNDIKFDDIKICDNLVINGHHRYISSLLAKKEIGNVPTQKTSATKIYEWMDVEFVEEEWDTQEKIDMLNKQDADFNNVPIAEIYEMTN